MFECGRCVSFHNDPKPPQKIVERKTTRKTGRYEDELLRYHGLPTTGKSVLGGRQLLSSRHWKSPVANILGSTQQIFLSNREAR